LRVAALSDIHGNLPALAAVLAEIEREGVDAIVVAGDTVAGPWPVEVFDAVVRLDAAIVGGNADRAVLERDVQLGRHPAWCADRLGDARLASIAAWPLTYEFDVDGLGRVLVCHSTPKSDEPIYTRITPDEDVVQFFAEVAADVVVCGHTHMQYDRRLSTGLRLVNPGSVGMPYEGALGAYWALLGPDVEMRRTEYDTTAAAAAIRALGAPAEQQVEILLEPPDPVETTEYFESLRGS
jgi:putative phosphoesterase